MWQCSSALSDPQRLELATGLCRGTCHDAFTNIISPNKIKGSTDIPTNDVIISVFTSTGTARQGELAQLKQIQVCSLDKYSLATTEEIWLPKSTTESSVATPQPLPGSAWHSCCRWSHWQFRCSEQLLQLVSLLQICSFLT